MNLALIEIMNNEIDRAIELFTLSKKRYQAIGNRSALALLESNWAMLCLLEDNVQGVEEHLSACQRLEIKNPIVEHSFYGVKALFFLEQRKFDLAVQYLEQARDIASKYQMNFKLVENQTSLQPAYLKVLLYYSCCYYFEPSLQILHQELTLMVLRLLDV